MSGSPGATVVVLPHPPLLLRELGGLADPVADLREACAAALRDALVPVPAGVAVVGPVEDPGAVDPSAPVDVRRFGTAGPRAGRGLPLSLGVGRRLLDEAGWSGPVELHGLRPDAEDPEVEQLARALGGRPGRSLVLLLGEGSARRDAKGPGMLDQRAFGFDDDVVRALREGDAPALASLDVTLARDLLVLGRASFRLLGHLGGVAGPPARAAVTYAESPYGVLYLVATWHW